MMIAKQSTIFLSAFFFLATGCSSNNSESESVDNGMAETEPIAATEQAIREQLDATWDALATQDLELFNQYTLSGWHLFTGQGNKVDAETLFASHRENMADFKLEYSQLEISVHDAVAWATYNAHMSGLWQGEDWGGDFIFTTIFVRSQIDGPWKIAHMHETKIQ